MPTLEQTTDYDLFQYDYDNPALTLDEAIKKASELRSKGGRDATFRIVPTDTKGTEFRVEMVPREQIVADFLTKFSGWVNKFTLARRLR